MSVTTVVPLRDTIQEIKFALNRWNDKQQSIQTVVELSEKQIIEVITNALNDSLSEDLNWVEPTNTLEEHLGELIKWYDAPGMRTLTSEFFYEVFDGLLKAKILMKPVLDAKPWDVKICKPYFGDAIIIYLGDYRILDWERRTRNEEFVKSSIDNFDMETSAVLGTMNIVLERKLDDIKIFIEQDTNAQFDVDGNQTNDQTQKVK